MTTTAIVPHQEGQVKLTELSPQMKKLVKKLKNEIVRFGKTASQITKEIAVQGIHDSLSKDQIRALIDFTIGDSLSDRQIQRIIPLELKYTEKIRTKKNKGQKSADMMSAKPESNLNEPTVVTVENTELPQELKSYAGNVPSPIESGSEMEAQQQQEQEQNYSQSQDKEKWQQQQIRVSSFNLALLSTYDRDYLEDVLTYFYQQYLRSVPIVEVEELRKKLSMYESGGVITTPAGTFVSVPREELLASKKEVTIASYQEACKYVNSQGIRSRQQWREYLGSNKGEIPSNIPHRPDNEYGKTGEWKGWKEFFESK